MVLPEPLWPTSTTLRSSSGRVGDGAGPADAALALMTTRWPLARASAQPPDAGGQYVWAHHAEPIRARLLHQALTPVARLLLRLGISPDVVTVVGTLGVCVGALAFYPRHSSSGAPSSSRSFVFSDTVDGVMARMSAAPSKWGAYLDSTLDRVGDAAIFGGLVLCYAGQRRRAVSWPALALACLILGSVVSLRQGPRRGARA